MAVKRETKKTAIPGEFSWLWRPFISQQSRIDF